MKTHKIWIAKDYAARAEQYLSLGRFYVSKDQPAIAEECAMKAVEYLARVEEELNRGK